MKFSVTRKINLANIDKSLWPYETEDISIQDADSLEEAHQNLDQAVSERIGYYKAKSEEARKTVEHPATPTTAGVPSPLPMPTAAAPAPAVPAQPTPPTTQPGVGNQPPAEFNV